MNSDMAEVNSGTVDRPVYTHFFGLRRSGNHAIINWMCEGWRHEDEPAIHFNSVAGYQKPERVPENMRRRIAEEAATQVVISYEDVCYDTRNLIPQYYEFTQPKKRDALLLRSFPNLVASRYQRMRNLEREGRFDSVHHRLGWAALSSLWVYYADEIVKNERPDMVGVLYDRWQSDRTYRDELAERLGFTNQDYGIDFVPPNARGSSFDGFIFQNNGNKMSTLKRWEAVLNDPAARQILLNYFTGHVAELNGELFGYSQLY